MTRQRLKRSIKIIRRCAEEISHKTDSLTASEEWIRDNLYFIEEQAEGVLGGLRYADLLFKECEALLYEDLNVDKVHKLIKDLDIDEEKLWSVVPTVKACAIIKIAENINGESVGDYVTFLRRITIEDFSQTVKDSSKLQQELLPLLHLLLLHLRHESWTLLLLLPF